MHETGYVRQDTGDWILETGDVRQVTSVRTKILFLDVIAIKIHS